MTQRGYIKALASALLLVTLTVFLAGSALAQLGEKDKEEIRLLVDTLFAVVIPAADRDFETLRTQRMQLSLSVPTWHTKVRLRYGWESRISDRDASTDFEMDCSIYPKNGSWAGVGHGGEWFDPMYAALRYILSGMLKDGWKRRSSKDNKYGEADYGTGEETRWTRKDGLTVVLGRVEDWHNDVHYSRMKQRDIRYISYVRLEIHVIKPK
jgi:hypothetical protein